MSGERIEGNRLPRGLVEKGMEFVNSEEYAKLRELRNECLVEAPLKLSQFANQLRAIYGHRSALAEDIEAYGLELKRMAEEAR